MSEKSQHIQGAIADSVSAWFTGSLPFMDGRFALYVAILLIDGPHAQVSEEHGPHDDYLWPCSRHAFMTIEQVSMPPLGTIYEDNQSKFHGVLGMITGE